MPPDDPPPRNPIAARAGREPIFDAPRVVIAVVAALVVVHAIVALGSAETQDLVVGDFAFIPGRLTLALTFPKPLSAPIPVSHVFYTPASTPVGHCSGPGHADPGYLCIYSSVIAGLLYPELLDPENDSNQQTGTLGFALTWQSTEVKGIGEDEVDLGSYTVTAP